MRITPSPALREALKSHSHAAALLARAEEELVTAQHAYQAANHAVITLAAKAMPFTTGKDYHIMAADRIARATCLYVEPVILPKNEVGFNAVFLLAGSKSVVCRIDHESLKSMANDEVTTSAVFSRDAITAGYHAARNEPENETD